MSNNILPRSAELLLQTKFGDSGGKPNALVYFSRVCSCVAANEMRPDPKCKLCVYGNIYDDEPEKILVTRTAMKLDRSVNERMYNFYMGGARITIYKYGLDNVPYKAHKYLAQYDVIVIPSDVRVNTSMNIYGKKDSLLNFNVTEIMNVSSRERDSNNEYVEILYKSGKDYEVELTDKISSIKWIEGGAHPSREYTVRYLSCVNLLVWEDHPKERGAADGEESRVVYCTLRPYHDPRQSPWLDIKTDPPLINKVG